MSSTDSALAQLLAMGFRHESARVALAGSSDVEAAISRLVGAAAAEGVAPTSTRGLAGAAPGAATIDLTADSPQPTAAAAAAAAAAGRPRSKLDSGRCDLQTWIAESKRVASDAELARSLQQQENTNTQRSGIITTPSQRPPKRSRADDHSFGCFGGVTQGTGPHAAANAAELAASQQPDLDARTDGLVDLLKDQYCRPAGKWSKRATAAICELCPHFTQKGFEGSVQGTSHWSCGYRNAQMLCAALLAGHNGAKFHGVLFGGTGVVPNVGGLQVWIERAWGLGWDAAARQTFAGSRLRDTSNWIGACEVWALLRSFGLQPVVVDFRDANREGLSDEAGRQRLVDWVWRYFTSPDPPDPSLQDAARPWRPQGTCAGAQSGAALRGRENLPHDVGGLRNHGLLLPERQFDVQFAGSNTGAGAGSAHGRASPYRPPLYLQHEGHSRTVVGIERRVDGVRTKKVTWNLLFWDPMKKGTQLRRAFAEGSAASRADARGAANAWAGGHAGTTWESLVKRGVHTLKKPQYQVLYVPPQVLSASDHQQNKAFKGVAYKP
eukprot:COSAG02_NODE_18_length_54986_cov_345.599322_12_plen_552_part_00